MAPHRAGLRAGLVGLVMLCTLAGTAVASAGTAPATTGIRLADIGDLSAVLDWLVAHTTADPQRIGAAGVSYGAGIALIGAAFDARIKAVAATSAWTDLVESLYGDHTRHPQAVWLLKTLADLFGTPSDEMRAMF